MKKKVLSLMLVLAMVMALTAPALAADYTEVVPCKYDKVEDFSEGLAAVCVDGKWGFIDKTGKEVVPPQYDDVNSFSEGLAAVGMGVTRASRIWGFIDKTGEVVIPIKYNNVRDFSEGLAVVGVKNGTGKDFGGLYFCDYGYIDKTDTVVIPLQYKNAQPFSEGLAGVRVNRIDGPWGYIDKTGQLVVPAIYDGVWNFSEGLAVVQSGNRPYLCGYVDKTGKEVIPCQYTVAGDFSEGLASVYVGEPSYGGIGFIDKTGKEVIPAKYSDEGTMALSSFSEGLAVVKAENRHHPRGYIDKTGKVVIPFEYMEARSFSEGLAPVAIGTVMSNSKWGYIDKTGQLVVPAMYDDAKNFSEGMAAVRIGDLKTGKWGFISLGGTQPEQPTTPATNAVLSPQGLKVDGNSIDCEKYNIGGSNYFKLRDLAQVLNGTGSQFEVGYDEATATVSITTGKPYTPNGTELLAGVDNSASAQPSNQAILIDGVSHSELTVYNIGGSNFFQLRGLGEVLGFEVDYDQATNTAIVNSVEK